MNKKIVSGIVILVLLILIPFSNFFYSVITDEGFTCDIVKDSCEGWSKCTIEEFKGEEIACVNGEQIIDLPDESPIQMNNLVVQGVSGNE